MDYFWNIIHIISKCLTKVVLNKENKKLCHAFTQNKVPVYSNNDYKINNLEICKREWKYKWIIFFKNLSIIKINVFERSILNFIKLLYKLLCLLFLKSLNS